MSHIPSCSETAYFVHSVFLVSTPNYYELSSRRTKRWPRLCKIPPNPLYRQHGINPLTSTWLPYGKPEQPIRGKRQPTRHRLTNTPSRDSQHIRHRMRLSLPSSTQPSSQKEKEMGLAVLLDCWTPLITSELRFSTPSCRPPSPGERRAKWSPESNGADRTEKTASAGRIAHAVFRPRPHGGPCRRSTTRPGISCLL